MLSNKSRSLNGFSLIELLITLAILAVLASVTIPMMEMTVKRTQEQELKTALRNIREAIDAYKQASNEGRITKSMEESGYPKNLEMLVEGVTDAKDIKKGKIYFMRRIPADPMNDSGEWGLRSYKSTAGEPKPGNDIFDIYSLSTDIGMNGLPYNEW
eukprot:Opistho-2@71395